MSWLIRSKLSPPINGFSVIERPRLLERLAPAPRRVTLIHAPAGYGKTTLLAQWGEQLSKAGFAVAWYSLDEEDEEPLTFLAYLAAALHEAAVPLGSLMQTLGEGQLGVSPRGAVNALLRALDECTQPVMILFEDLHRVRTDRIDALLNTLVERLPRHVHLCFTTRTRPTLRLAALRANGNLTQVEAGDLRFTLDETSTYLAGTTTPRTAALLHQQVEGWPVAVQLGRLHLQSGGDAELADLAIAPDGEIADYFAEQVLRGLPEQTRETLLRIAVLERINAGLVERLCDRTDGAAVLDQLHAANLFLYPVDRGRSWYRMHPLFAEHLRVRLARDEPSVSRRLHRQAAIWLGEHGFLADAARHATLTGDLDLLRGLLERAGGWRLLMRAGPAYFRIFRDLPDEVVAPSVSLRLAQAYVFFRIGRIHEARSAMNLILAALQSDPENELRPDVVMLEFALRSRENKPIRAADIEAIERDMARFAARDPIVNALVADVIAWGRFWVGDFQGGAVIGEIGVQRCRETEMPVIENYCRTAAALSCIELGQLDRADRIVREGRIDADRTFGFDSEQSLFLRVLEAELAFERGEDVREIVLPLLDQLDETETWFDSCASAYRMAIALAVPEELDALCNRCVDLARRLDHPGLGRIARVARLRRNLAARDSEAITRSGDRGLLEESGEFADWRVDEAVRLAQAELGITERRGRQAIEQMALLSRHAQSRGHQRLQLRAQVLRALAEIATGLGDAAQRTLAEALQLAGDTGAVRPFLEQLRTLRPFLAAIEARGDLSQRARAMLAYLLLLCRDDIAEQAVTAEATNGGLLSPREQEILQLIADGQTSKEAANRLGISVNTVMYHRKNLFRKLQSTTRARAMAAARSIGILP